MDLRSPETADDFERYYRFRWEQLRAPWHQPPGSEQDELEDQAVHLMVEDDRGRIIGVARLHAVQDAGAGFAQIRYMAVAQELRGQGVGAMLLRKLEEIALARGLSEIRLHARESAVAFYKRRCYQIVEPSHTLYDSIRHFLMRKDLPHG